jgi:2-polyprenyl-3-methyl-5-hydroxy-6-metoxy-1,4-benzoquinol methylase
MGQFSPDSCISFCRVCGSQNLVPDRTLPIVFAKTPQTASFMLCVDCGTLLSVDVGLLDYEHDNVAYYSGDDALRWTLSYDAGYYFYLTLLGLLKDAAPDTRRFLDVGGSFGALAHMGKLLHGWEVTSAEPAERSRQGGEALGINYISGYVDENSFANYPMDAITASEVLEHVPDPDAFVQTLRANLAQDGVLLLSTPNADVININAQQLEAEFAESYAAGQHYNLFSARSLDLLLQRNGFINRKIYLAEGQTGQKSLIALASTGNRHVFSGKKIPTLKTVEEQFDWYCGLALAEPTRTEWHAFYKTSLKLRMFELLVNQGRYEKADAWVQEFEDELRSSDLLGEKTPLVISAKSREEFLAQYPSFIGKYYFYKGTMLLNAQQNEQAALYCTTAFNILGRMQAFGFFSIEEMIGLSGLHAAIAFERLGKKGEACEFLRKGLSYDLSDTTATRLKEQLVTCGGFHCRICGSASVTHESVRHDPAGKSVVYARCDSCRMVMDTADEVRDYSASNATYYNSESQVKFYIGIEAGFLFFADLLSLLHSNTVIKKTQRVLDLGGGVGILAHMAKTLYGWNVTSADPSPRCAIGKEMLGVDSLNAFVDEHTFGGERFDALVCSEVLEHVPDPDAFIAMVRKITKDDGVVLFTTPNAEAIPLEDGEVEEIFAPGYHYNIFSSVGIEAVFHRNGFANTLVLTIAGKSGAKRLVVLATGEKNKTLAPNTFGDTDANAAVFIDYGRKALAEPTLSDWHAYYKETIRYRLVESLTNNGQLEDAAMMALPILESQEKKGFSPALVQNWLMADSFDGYLKHHHPFLGKFYYYCGLILLHSVEYEQAYVAFRGAALILRSQRRLNFYFLEEMIGLALLHEGLALAFMEREAEARELWQQEVDAPDISESARARIVEQLSQVSEKRTAHTSVKSQFSLEESLLKAMEVIAQNTGIASRWQVARGRPILQKALSDYHRFGQLASGLERAMHAAETDYPAMRRLGSGLERGMKKLEADYPKVRRIGAKVEQGLDQLEQDYPRFVELADRSVEFLNNMEVLQQKMELSMESVRQRTLQAERFYAQNRHRIHDGIKKFASFQEALSDFARKMSAPFEAFRAVKNAWARLHAGFRYPGLTALGTRLVFPPPRKRGTGFPNVFAFHLLLDDCVVEQEFIAVHDTLAGISLFLGHERLRHGSMVVLRLFDGETELANKRFSSRLFHEAFTPVPLATLPGMKGKKLTLRLTVEGASSQDAILLWCRDAHGYGGMKFNGKAVWGASLALGQLETMRSIQAGVAKETERRDILIITPGELGDIRVGLGMRHWEIAAALASMGKTVTLASTQKRKTLVAGEGFVVLEDGWRGDIDELLATHATVLTQGGAFDAVPELMRYTGKLIIDLITPYHIEDLHRGDAEFQYGHESLSRMLKRGDAFICGNESQRIYWMGMLMALRHCEQTVPFINRADALASENISVTHTPKLFSHAALEDDPEFRRVIDIVEFGVRETAPVKRRPVLKGVEQGIDEGDFVIMWFGGIWNWLDPIPLLRAVAEAHAQAPRIKLYFSMYREKGKNPTARAIETKKYAEHHGLLGQCVFFKEYPVSFAERDDYLLESDLGIFVQTKNLETTLSARTRVYDYIWAGLIPFMNEGDEMAAVLKRTNSGFVIKEYSKDEVRDALVRAARDASLRAEVRENLMSLRESLLWTKQVMPIVEHINVLTGKPETA